MRFLADEDFNHHIIGGVLNQLPATDFVTIAAAGLRSLDDASIIEWAANHSRIVLSHDVTTMRKHAYERIGAGVAMAGLFLIHQSCPIGTAVKELVLIIECSRQEEWHGRVQFLPL